MCQYRDGVRFGIPFSPFASPLQPSLRDGVEGRFYPPGVGLPYVGTPTGHGREVGGLRRAGIGVVEV